MTVIFGSTIYVPFTCVIPFELSSYYYHFVCENVYLMCSETWDFTGYFYSYELNHNTLCLCTTSFYLCSLCVIGSFYNLHITLKFLCYGFKLVLINWEASHRLNIYNLGRMNEFFEKSVPKARVVFPSVFCYKLRRDWIQWNIGIILVFNVPLEKNLCRTLNTEWSE